jgi:2',3'-cyclic-nucleotide 2'-phosphodiesterase (5'-nucleotidase family)
MSKTTNFLPGRRLSAFSFFLCLLLLCAQGTAAQQRKAVEPSPVATPVVKARSQSAVLPTPVQIESRASQTVVDAATPDDPAIDKMLEPYSARVKALDVVIGRLEGELRKGGMGGGSVGNFVADAMRAQAGIKLGQPVALVVTNTGGMRKNAIAPGELRVQDIFELMPFENKLVELELTGAELLNVLKAVVSSSAAQSGARIKYRTGADQKPELVSARLIAANGRQTDIDRSATYRMVTIDYLLSVSGGGLSILQQAKNRKPLEVTIRDAIIEYVKAKTAAGRTVKAKLDGRFANENPRPRKTEDPPL